MKDFFIRLFNYDRSTNEAMLETLVKSSRPEKAIQLMAHLLTAQQIWINRCKHLPAFTVALWQEDGKIEEFADLITKSNSVWIDYLEALSTEDFEKIISYNNLKGDPFKSRLTDILMHVINHGTHHRAQIGQHLKHAGVESLPVTDYIAYTRQINS